MIILHIAGTSVILTLSRYQNVLIKRFTTVVYETFIFFKFLKRTNILIHKNDVQLFYKIDSLSCIYWFVDKVFLSVSSVKVFRKNMKTQYVFALKKAMMYSCSCSVHSHERSVMNCVLT